MEDVIYRFLLQCGYPRAAIVTDLGLLPVAGSANGAIPSSELARPSLAIVDPLTVERLALIDVRGAIDGNGLEDAAAELGLYAQRFGGRAVQGFVIRLEAGASDPDARVQFYRVWPNETLERISARTFPDLDTLRTLLRLNEQVRDAVQSHASAGSAVADAPVVADDAFDGNGMLAKSTIDRAAASRSTSPGALAWLPGLVLLLLAIADWALGQTRGQQLLSTVQAVLAVGAAALLLWPVLARRQSR